MNSELRNDIVNTVIFFCKVRNWPHVHRQKIAESVSKEHKGEKGYSFASVTRTMEEMTQDGKELGGLKRLGRGYYTI